MEEFAVNELRAYGIPVDDSLTAYSGRPIRISNGIIAFLKQRFGVKPSFSIFRRLTGIVLDDDYRGEAIDRDVFRRKVRVIQERFERLDKSKCDPNAFLAEEFVHDFQFMDKAVKEADKRRSLKNEKPTSGTTGASSQSVANVSSDGSVLDGQGECSESAPANKTTVPFKKAVRRKGRKRILLERKPKSSLRHERLMRSKALAQRRLAAKQHVLQEKSNGSSSAKNSHVDQENVKAEMDSDFGDGSDEALLKIVEQDDIQLPTSSSGNHEDTLKSLRAALRREKFAKKRIQVLSYRLRDEKLSLQETQRKLRQLEKVRTPKAESVPEAKVSQWKNKAKEALQELETARLELSKLREINHVLAERCHQYHDTEVALKPNGKYLDDLSPCLQHLLSAGVPAEKCGEVLVVVATLLGKKIVAEKSIVLETVSDNVEMKSS